MKRIVIGIDEAGRGPLAGPICVAGVATKVVLNVKKTNFHFLPILPDCISHFTHMREMTNLKEIKDSKKLSAKQREEWRKIIRENFECAMAFVSSEVIDKIGISKATRLCVARVLRKFTNVQHSMLNTLNTVILLDGALRAPKKYEQQTIIKGDEKIPLISAASIIAKTSRDAKMLRIHKKYPQYCFDKHKGYGTKLHYKMLKKHGPSPIHRRSFL